MIAANGVIARYLSSRNFPSIRRVVRTPKRWDRIVEIAGDHEFKLPDIPDSKALEEFLVKQKAADPLRFPDLSLAVIKLLGSGEYIAELPDGDAPGHFGLAVKDYVHSTAPNRRYPDLLTQRLLKAALEGKPVPYGKDELDALAAHCTEAEDAAHKGRTPGRQIRGRASARIENRGAVRCDCHWRLRRKAPGSGCSPCLWKGNWCSGFEGVDVGDRLRVQLTSVDVQRGFIDFRKINS